MKSTMPSRTVTSIRYSTNLNLQDSEKNDTLVFREAIVGANRFSNYIWVLILSLGGSGFFLAGFSSYFKFNFLFFTNTATLNFIPQGILLLFYGTLAILLALFIFLWTREDVGSGFNEYDTENQVVRVFRKGFSFFKNDIYLVYPFTDVRNLELEVVDNINPRRTIYLCLKDKRRIPLNPSTVLSELSSLESRASYLAQLLQVNLILNRESEI